MIPDEPLDYKTVSALRYGDIVTSEGDHVMNTDIFLGPNRPSKIRISNGETLDRRHNDKLPFYGNVSNLTSR